MGRATRLRRGGAILLAAGLIHAGCGGEEERAPEPGAGGATGAQGKAVYDISVGEFIAELQPQKQAILEALVADSAACRGVEADNGFVLLVTAQAIDADQDEPLAALVEDQC